VVVSTIPRCLPSDHMRVFEVLLSVVTLLGVVASATTPRRPAVRPVTAAAITVVAVLHLVVEGRRWQMVPVYAVALSVVVAAGIDGVRSHRTAAPTGASRAAPSRAPRWLRVTGAAVGVVLVALGAGLAVVLPVPSLPPPDGPYGVGVTKWEVVDAARTEQYGPTPGGPRRLMATAWYPTDESGDPSPWVSDPGPFAEQVGPQVGVPGFVLGHLAYVTTPAISDARLAPATGIEARWPVVVYSHGWAGFASIQSDLAERLASEGFVVLALDHTYGAAVTTFPDGTVAPQDPAALPDQDDVGAAASDAAATQLEATFADDVAFLLDDLEGGNGPTVLPGDDLALDRVGLVGHSTGAGATVWLCLVDDRCAGLVGFDPWVEPVPPGLLVNGLAVPVVSVRSEDWQGNDNDAVLRRLHAASPGDRGMYVVPGATHRDFTLLPFLSPAAGALGLSGQVDARAMHADMEELTVAFFDEVLRDGTAALPILGTIVAEP
jgi:dienelactone hydrolase